MQNRRAKPLGEAKHVDGAQDTSLGGLYRIELIMDRGCWPGQIVNLVDFYKQWECDVVAEQLKVPIVHQRLVVAPGAGEKVIDTQNLSAAVQKGLA